MDPARKLRTKRRNDWHNIYEKERPAQEEPEAKKGGRREDSRRQEHEPNVPTLLYDA